MSNAEKQLNFNGCILLYLFTYLFTCLLTGLGVYYKICNYINVKMMVIIMEKIRCLFIDVFLYLFVSFRTIFIIYVGRGKDS